MATSKIHTSLYFNQDTWQVCLHIGSSTFFLEKSEYYTDKKSSLQYALLQQKALQQALFQHLPIKFVGPRRVKETLERFNLEFDDFLNYATEDERVMNEFNPKTVNEYMLTTLLGKMKQIKWSYPDFKTEEE